MHMKRRKGIVTSKLLVSTEGLIPAARGEGIPLRSSSVGSADPPHPPVQLHAQRSTPTGTPRGHEKTCSSATISNLLMDLEKCGQHHPLPPARGRVGGPSPTPSPSPSPSPSPRSQALQLLRESAAATPPLAPLPGMAYSAPTSPSAFYMQQQRQQQQTLLGSVERRRMPFMSRGSSAASSSSSTAGAPHNKSSLFITNGRGGENLTALHQQQQQRQQEQQQHQHDHHHHRHQHQHQIQQQHHDESERSWNNTQSQGHHIDHHEKLDNAHRSEMTVASAFSGTADASSASALSCFSLPTSHLGLHNGPPAAAISPSPSPDHQELAKALMPDFAVSSPTPHYSHSSHHPLNDDLLGTTSALPISHPVRFGALIRLWIAEEDVNSKMAGCGGGGFLGFAARDLRRIQGELPQASRFNVGMNDTFFVLPPYKPGRGWHFRETYFRVEEAGCAKEGGREGDRQGEVVKYGEGLLLVDEEDHVMCHFRGRKYIRRKPKGTRGEMSVSFLPPHDDMLHSEIHYGDTDIRIQLATRKGIKTETTILSALRRETIDAVGGFLNCVGRGKELTFDIEHAPPRISEVSVTSTHTTTVGLQQERQQQYVHRSLHHRVHWGQTVGFVTPSCQAHTAEAHEGPIVRITLSNGSRLKITQKHMAWVEGEGGREEGGGFDGKRREAWLPTRGGMPGENVDVFVRFEQVGTMTLDPRKHFGAPATVTAAAAAAAGGIGSNSSSVLQNTLMLLQHYIPPSGVVGLFLLLDLVASPNTHHTPLSGRLCEEVHVLLALLSACILYSGLQQSLAFVRIYRHQKQQQQSCTSLPSLLSCSTSSLPPTLLCDRWELVVLDWRAANDDDSSLSPPLPPALPPPLPPTFLNAEKGDVEKAQARWTKTLAWRKANNVDHILSQPHPKFDLIKKMYPQAFHYKDKQGHVCFYEILGKLQVGELLRQGVDLSDLTKHIIVQQEFLWGILQPAQTDRVTLVMDLKGVSFADVTGEVVNFAKMAVGLTSTHYPARSCRMLIVFVPGWFNLIFRFIKPMLNEDTKRKIIFLDEREIREGAMLEFIDSEFLPKEYGGTCEVPLGKSPFEVQLKGIVDAAGAAAAVAAAATAAAAAAAAATATAAAAAMEGEEEESD